MDSGMDSDYVPPLGLTIISSISIGIAGLVALWIMLDIIWRRGWKTMMAIMIPVYIINALYLWPITLWTYLSFGRPAKPGSKTEDGHATMHHDHAEAPMGEHHAGHATAASPTAASEDKANEAGVDHSMHGPHAGHENNKDAIPGLLVAAAAPSAAEHGHDLEAAPEAGQHDSDNHHSHHAPGLPGEATDMKKDAETPKQPAAGGHNMHAHMHGGADLPMFANVTIAVCHCGAGCVLGDVIGEWIVYGTGAAINGRSIWPEWLIDFVLALFFGIFFQYFSIAPATGEYGLRTVWRATTADFLSLVAFEVGLFGWMAIFQIAIFRWMLETNTVTYWFMMQIGMFLGHWTAVPVNWWLLKANIKVSIH